MPSLFLFLYTATPKTPWLATGMKESVMLSAEPTLLGSPLAQIPRGLPRGRVYFVIARESFSRRTTVATPI